MQINDGTGRGYVAKVTQDNRLATEALEASSQASRNGKAYTVAGIPAAGVTSTGGVMLLLINDSQTDSILVDQVTVSGDSTKLVVYERSGYTVGTIADADVANSNALNTTYPDNNSVSAYLWDGSNHGIGGLSGTTDVLGAYTLSTTPLNVNHGGNLIIGPGKNYAVYLDNNSGGAQNAAITVKYFMAAV